jgi:hypothetical protein
MARPATLIEAQRRYIEKRNGCTTGHWRRAARAAARELRKYLARIGVTNEKQIEVIVQDARDMAALEREFDED